MKLIKILLDNIRLVIYGLSGFWVALTGVSLGIPRLMELNIPTFWITLYALGMMFLCVLIIAKGIENVKEC